MTWCTIRIFVILKLLPRHSRRVWGTHGRKDLQGFGWGWQGDSVTSKSVSSNVGAGNSVRLWTKLFWGNSCVNIRIQRRVCCVFFCWVVLFLEYDIRWRSSTKCYDRTLQRCKFYYIKCSAGSTNYFYCHLVCLYNLPENTVPTYVHSIKYRRQMKNLFNNKTHLINLCFWAQTN